MMPPTNKADLHESSRSTGTLKRQLDDAVEAAQTLLKQQECLYEILDAKDQGRGQSDKAKDYSEAKYNNAKQRLSDALRQLRSSNLP